MELPFHLKTLPPAALDVMRFFATLDEPTADVEAICEGAGLSERMFGKCIRRLVTKGYLQMDGDQVYRLTENGQKAVEDLVAYDEVAPPDQALSGEEAPTTTRRLVLVTPRELVAGAVTNIHVGFNTADEPALSEPADVVVRLNVQLGEPQATVEKNFALTDSSASNTFQVTPGQYNKTRLKLKVFQLGPNPDDIAVCGGMYVDVDVRPSPDMVESELVAYGADVTITLLEE